MAYIGPLPAETFTSFATQEFSTSATTSYTLDHPVTNENELALFINNVRQQPGSGKAYTASGTALTLSAATASTDTMYAVFLGRALQTVNPADASVGTSQLAATSVTAAKLNNDIISGTTALAEAPADTDEFLVSDAGTLKRIDFSLIKGGGMFELISTTTVTSGVSSVDFTSLSSDFADFRLSASQVDIANDNEILRIRAFVGGSEHTSSDYQYVRRGFNGAAAETEDQAGGTEWRIGDNIGNAGGESASFEFTIFAVHDTSHSKQYLSQFAGQANDSAPVYQAGGGNLDNTSAITGLKVYQASGNINSGVFSLYGRKR
jgi:hypothetical protein